MTRNTITKQAVFCLIIALIFGACTDKNKFTVEGNIKNGAGKILYFENITTNSIILLDSAKIKSDGKFKFTRLRPEAPDFYRIRLNRQFITFSIDSTETVNIQSDTLTFAKNYTVEGSDESEKIKTLSALQATTADLYNKLQKQFETKSITADEYVAQTGKVIDDYKSEARKYIYENPGSSSAYFALYQQINKLLIFDPYDKNDSKAFGAVANVWNMNYPNAVRTKQLISHFADGLKVIRGENPANNVKEIDSREYFDFELPNIADKLVRLSEVGKGKVVLLDFTALALEGAPAHNLLLAEVYGKLKPRGFEIVQVSLDTDVHIWKNAGINLPWITVRDPQSVQSELVRRYNVTAIPAGFILNRNGEFVKRLDNFDNLEKEIAKFL